MNKKISRATAGLGVALLLAPIGAVGAVLQTDAGAAIATRVLTCPGTPSFKPSTYTLSCADAGAGWTDVTWSTWTSTSASGHGILRQNDCTPNCAGGKFIDYRATVTLSKVITSKKYGALFSQAIFHYRVGGVKKSETFDLAD
jgi:hypothetical protein